MGSNVGTSEGELSTEQQLHLLELARTAINHWVSERSRLQPDQREGIYSQQRAVFVTLRERGQLRGCIGTLEPQEALVDAVVSRAIGAATQDPRFPPVEERELPQLSVHVSVLSPVEPIGDPSEIVLGKHGVIVKHGGGSGVFLPQVAPEQGWDTETMLNRLCSGKAGLDEDAWRTGARLFVFTTQNFGDEEH